MRAICIIPARLESARLPGKLLLNETGRPLICHTVEAALSVPEFDRVVVATNDIRVAEAAGRHPKVLVLGNIRPESQALAIAQGYSEPRNGTERVAEAAAEFSRRAVALAGTSSEHAYFEPDLVVGLQADEPEITPEALGGLVAAMFDHGRDIPYGTLVRKRPATLRERFDPNVVRAQINYPPSEFERGPAFDFTRGGPGWRYATCAVHVGVYAWWPEALAMYANMPSSPREQAEGLEQLRCVGAGWPCLAVAADHEGSGVNTRADYDAFVARWKARQGGQPNGRQDGPGDRGDDPVGGPADPAGPGPAGGPAA